MKKYEYLEHTADAKFRAYGRTMEEAFSNAALALTNIMTDVTKIKGSIGKEILVISKTHQALLYDFLEELIVLMDTEGILLGKVKSCRIKKGPKLELSAELLFDKAEKYDIHTQIKAITYNDMEIKKKGNLYMVQAVPDL